MAVEIERKFLVKAENLTFDSHGEFLCQAYLTEDPSRTVRVRIAGARAFLTIKGPSNGISRNEFEYPIPVEDALEIIKLAVTPPIEKTRYKIKHNDIFWELDIFHGENEGLILAEVELQSENQEISLPEWIGKEVSGDPRYYNSQLSKVPFQTWPENKLV